MKRFDVACVGHLVYDVRDYVKEFPQPDKTSFMRMPSQFGPGGSAANVSMNCLKLNHTAGLIATTGADLHGNYLIAELAKRGVDITRIKQIRKGRTGLSVILIDEHGQVMVIEDPGSADEPRNIESSFISSARWVHMTGCPLSWLEQASKNARKHEIPLSFDPGRAASHNGIKKLEKIIERVDVLILNQKELGAISGSQSKEKIRTLSKEFNLTAILKVGHGPASVSTFGGALYDVPPFNAPKVVDTLGAGDAFASGVICGRLEKRSFYEAVRMGHACAASKVMNAGAQGMPKREKIRKHFKF